MLILDLINKRAKRTYGNVITKENFNDFIDHWFNVAEELKNEYAEQGLHKTVEHISEVVEKQRLIMNSTRRREIV